MAKRSKNKTSEQEKGKFSLRRPTTSLKQNRGQDESMPVTFQVQKHGPLILLHFTNPKTQHQALARMEAFYESKSEAKNYISLHDPKTEHLCRNYEAFNMPVCAIQEWLQAMKIAEHVSSSTQDTAKQFSTSGWWRPFTSSQESLLLTQLWTLGLFNMPKGCVASSYLISVTNKSAIHHELLHALFFFHPGYRDKVEGIWRGLSRKCRMRVSNDLSMRDYGEQVWVDEFQAYVSENAGEFGGKVSAECNGAGIVLREAQAQAWEELNVNISQFT